MRNASAKAANPGKKVLPAAKAKSKTVKGIGHHLDMHDEGDHMDCEFEKF